MDAVVARIRDAARRAADAGLNPRRASPDGSSARNRGGSARETWGGQPVALPVMFQAARRRAGTATRSGVVKVSRAGCGSTSEPTVTAPGGQRLQVGLREPQGAHRRDDPPVLDQPDAVAGEPGPHRALRVDHAGVPEVADQQPALEAGHQVVHRAAGAGGQRGVARRPARRSRSRRRRGRWRRGRAPAATRRSQVSPTGTPSAHQVGRAARACPRCRRAGRSRRGERVVDQRHRGVELLLARAGGPTSRRPRPCR